MWPAVAGAVIVIVASGAHGLVAMADADDGCPGDPFPGCRNRFHEVLLRRRDGGVARRTMNGVSCGRCRWRGPLLGAIAGDGGGARASRDRNRFRAASVVRRQSACHLLAAELFGNQAHRHSGWTAANAVPDGRTSERSRRQRQGCDHFRDILGGATPVSDRVRGRSADCDHGSERGRGRAQVPAIPSGWPSLSVPPGIH